MRKILLYTIFACFSIYANAQFFISPNVKLGVSNFKANNSFKAGGSLSLGSDFGVELFKHLQVSIGFGYLRNGFGDKNFDDGSPTMPGYKPYIKTKDEDKLIVNSFYMPLKVGYIHHFEEIDIFFKTGVYSSLYDKYKSDLKSQKAKSNSESSKIYWGYLLQFGVGYRLSEKLSLNASFEYNSTFDRVKVKESDSFPYNSLSMYYSAGANIGISYYF